MLCYPAASCEGLNASWTVGRMMQKMCTELFHPWEGGCEAVAFVHHFLSPQGCTQMAIIQCPILTSQEKLFAQGYPDNSS